MHGGRLQATGSPGADPPHGPREEPTLAALILDFWPLDPGGGPFLPVQSLVWQPGHQQTVTRNPWPGARTYEGDRERGLRWDAAELGLSCLCKPRQEGDVATDSRGCPGRAEAALQARTPPGPKPGVLRGISCVLVGRRCGRGPRGPRAQRRLGRPGQVESQSSRARTLGGTRGGI